MVHEARFVKSMFFFDEKFNLMTAHTGPISSPKIPILIVVCNLHLIEVRPVVNLFVGALFDIESDSNHDAQIFQKKMPGLTS